MSDKLMFDHKKDKTVLVTIDQLKQSMSLANSQGNLPATRPENHADVFLKVSDMLTQANQPHTIEPVIIGTSEALRNPVWDPTGEGVLPSWVFNRLIGRITLDGVGVSDEESKSAIAITYDPKGIVMAYGQNVNVCQNMSIFGGRMIKTWGKGSASTSFMNMLEVIEKWIGEREKIREHDIQIFNQLKDIRIDRAKQMAELLGNMLKVACAQYNEPDEDIIRIGDVTALAQMYTKKYPKDESGEISGWDFYNMGTNILTHSKSNLTNKLQRTSMFGDFIAQELITAN